ncbi:hypothetical protein L1987_78977 [Smallanthus sonchifolius]|uniref:Uncharacterized protein n=1 Tax=Smallanthus sonchifolius TaxID=185202 RepID=A0ACB8ZES2_9ASTR|nr:hypothetical protein L1987_78977 [Smallanthus sonchifolius]
MAINAKAFPYGYKRKSSYLCNFHVPSFSLPLHQIDCRTPQTTTSVHFFICRNRFAPLSEPEVGIRSSSSTTTTAKNGVISGTMV